MAAVENLAEVIKDSDKEHVSAARKESLLESTTLHNGDSEPKRYVFLFSILHNIPSYL